MHLANHSLFIDTACLLWAFKIGDAVDMNGVPIVSPDVAFVDIGNRL